MTLKRIAALYVDRLGPYARMALVELWDERRDARLYEGPWSVVAHPPCGPWGAFSHLCRSPKQDPALALRAIEQVRRWGGVLEHPRHSRLFADERLPPPGSTDGHGFTLEVDQLHWGHVAHKRTWLYCVGVDPAAVTPPPWPDRKPTHDLMGGRGRNAGADRRGIIEASKELRRRTPPAFAEWLVQLARSVDSGALARRPQGG